MPHETTFLVFSSSAAQLPKAWPPRLGHRCEQHRLEAYGIDCSAFVREARREVSATPSVQIHRVAWPVGVTDYAFSG